MYFQAGRYPCMPIPPAYQYSQPGHAAAAEAGRGALLHCRCGEQAASCGSAHPASTPLPAPLLSGPPQDPAQLLAIFSQLEGSNMFQIAAAQEAEAALEVARATHAATQVLPGPRLSRRGSWVRTQAHDEGGRVWRRGSAGQMGNRAAQGSTPPAQRVPSSP